MTFIRLTDFVKYAIMVAFLFEATSGNCKSRPGRPLVRLRNNFDSYISYPNVLVLGVRDIYCLSKALHMDVPRVFNECLI